MDIESYIASGILENYCMGFCTEAEKAEVEKNAALYPRIDSEIGHIRSVFEQYILSNNVDPSPRVKQGVMEAIYRQQSGVGKEYPPLLMEGMPSESVTEWLTAHPFSEPDQEYENLFMRELPSTPHITNFLVWAKYGHDTEMHTDFDEYLYILKGTCRMFIGDHSRVYKEGEVICIPPHVNHNAVISSNEPMVAMVQRRQCA